jgi:hypothetical protein
MRKLLILLSVNLLIANTVYATDFSKCSFWDTDCKIQKIKTDREQEKAGEREQVEQYKHDRAERDAAHEIEIQEKIKQAAENEAAYKNYEREETERKQKERDDSYAKMKAEQATATAAQEKEDAKLRAVADRADRTAQKKQDVLKAKCGDDYKNPQIGMTLARVKECVAPVKLVSQVNRADGVASMYQYGALWLNVMQGHVVAWGR